MVKVTPRFKYVVAMVSTSPLLCQSQSSSFSLDGGVRQQGNWSPSQKAAGYYTLHWIVIHCRCGHGFWNRVIKIKTVNFMRLLCKRLQIFARSAIIPESI